MHRQHNARLCIGIIGTSDESDRVSNSVFFDDDAADDDATDDDAPDVAGVRRVDMTSAGRRVPLSYQ